jgi:outer membrane murein-binding lipoprotein Lpp
MTLSRITLSLLLQLFALRGGEDVMRNTGICLVAIVLGTLALAGCSRESADWKSATAADTAEAYQQFLQQHPKSANAVQAQARITQIGDDRDWQAAAAADTRDAYGQYLAQHADGKWAQEARIRIENFAQGGTSAGNAAAAGASAGAAINASGPAAAAQPATSAPGAAAAPKPAPAPSAASSHASAPGSAVASSEEHGHFVQLGAFHSKARAESEWKKLSARYPSELKSLKPHYVAAKSRSGEVYKLRARVSSLADARGLCATLKKHAQACVPVKA